MRRIALGVFGGLAAVLISIQPGLAKAQAAYPTKPVKWVLNFPPGGPSDLIARLIGERLLAAYKQPVVIESKPGAAGNIGADIVAKSPADGYTLLMTIDTPFTINPSLYPNLPFKVTDFKPVMIIASSSLLFAVHPSLGASSVADILAKAKVEPVNFSSAGSGSPGHMAASMLAESTGAKVNHVMYKGNTPAVMAIVSGEVPAAIIATPGLLPHVQAGKIKPIAVTSRKRSPLLPDVPTTSEAGLKGVEFEVMYVLMAPAATPPAVLASLQKELTAALADPVLRETFRKADLDIVGETGAVAEAHLKASRDRYAQTIKATHMKVE